MYIVLPDNISNTSTYLNIVNAPCQVAEVSPRAPNMYWCNIQACNGHIRSITCQVSGIF